MTWLALLLLGVAAADLTRSAHPGVSSLPATIGGGVVVAAGLLVGVTDLWVLALVVLVAVVVGWALLTDRAGGTGSTGSTGSAGSGSSGSSASLALGWLGGAVLALLVVPLPARTSWGVFERWLDGSAPGFLAGSPAEAALLLIAAGGLMSSSGNVLVRLVLQASGTSRPGAPSEPASQLKGGRLLGPMERLFIFGLGLGGNFTAAGIVIAAKGLIRWPELQSKREQGRVEGATGGADIDEITEYFLVGSFLSWMIALAGVLLVDGQLHLGP